MARVMFCDRVAWVIEWEGGAIKESVMGVDQSGVLDKATWEIAGAIWRWLWFRQRLYSLLLLLVWSALFAMGGIFFGFQESDFPSFFLWVAGIMVLPCEVVVVGGIASADHESFISSIDWLDLS